MLYIGIVGIFLVVIGWIISNSEHIPIIDRVLFRKYTNALSAFNKMHQNDFILRKGDKGFSELAEIILSNTTGASNPDMTQIKTIGWGQKAVSTTEGIKWMDFLNAEVSFSNYPPLPAEFRELRQEIEDRYRRRGLFVWGGILFWAGIVTSIVALYLQYS